MGADRQVRVASGIRAFLAKMPRRDDEAGQTTRGYPWVRERDHRVELEGSALFRHLRATTDARRARRECTRRDRDPTDLALGQQGSRSLPPVAISRDRS